MNNKFDKNDLDESYYFNENKIHLSNTKMDYYIFNKVIILLILILIINLAFKIKIFFRLELLNILNNKDITMESKKIFQLKGIDFYNPPLEKTDLDILKPILSKNSPYIELTLNEQKFFNGLLRKVKPKKIIEIGVSSGGSAILILNAIKDIEGAKLYSIDISNKAYKFPEQPVGFAVKKFFPELMSKWKLYSGGITSDFIEEIGGEIDLAFIDSAHYTPGEMLDWLQVLPFLKEEAIVVLHDTFLMYSFGKVDKIKMHYSNIHLLTYIRGELILPNYGNSFFSRNIGAIKLKKNQQQYYEQYFLALGIQWEYMLGEENIISLRKLFNKYYGSKYTNIFNDAVVNNKKHLSLM